MALLEAPREVALEPQAFAAEDLIAESRWVHALARRLLGDVELADELAQETIVAALESNPRDPSRRSAWLSGILRNRWRLHARGQSRRRARERAVARDEVGNATPDVVEQMEIHGQLVDALLALPEPYRTTLALRYYRDLSSSEIADALGTSNGAIRTRLSRGLDLLRTELDRRSDGDRKSWTLALAGWLNVASSSVVATGGAGSTLLSSTSSKLALATAAMVTLAVIGWFAAGDTLLGRNSAPIATTGKSPASTSREPVTNDPAGTTTPPPSSGSGAASGGAVPIASGSDSFANLSEALAAVTVELEPTDWPIVGRVVDRAKQPIAGQKVTATPFLDSGRWSDPLSIADMVHIEAQNDILRRDHQVSAVTDSDGFFELRGLSWFRYEMSGTGFPAKVSPGEFISLTVKTPRVVEEQTIPIEVVGRSDSVERGLELWIRSDVAERRFRPRDHRPLELPEGDWEIVALLDGAPISDPVAITVPYADPSPVRVTLHPLATLTVEPVGIDPASYRALSMRLTRIDPAVIPDADVLLNGPMGYSRRQRGPCRTVRLDPSGAFQADVPPGEYLVALVGSRHVWASDTVTITSDTILPLEPSTTGMIRAFTRGLGQVQIDQCSFSYGLTLPNGRASGTLHGMRLNDGSFALPLDDRLAQQMRTPGSKLLVSVETPVGSRVAEVSQNRVDLHFDQGTPTTLVVHHDIPESRRDDYLIRFVAISNNGAATLGERFDLADYSDLGLMQPGTYKLQLRPSAFSLCDLVLAETEVEIGSNKAALALTVPPIHPVVFELSGAACGAVRFRPTGRDETLLFMSETTTMYLPKGEYTAAPFSGSSPSQTFSVPNTTTIRIGG